MLNFECLIGRQGGECRAQRGGLSSKIQNPKFLMASKAASILNPFPVTY